MSKFFTWLSQVCTWRFWRKAITIIRTLFPTNWGLLKACSKFVTYLTFLLIKLVCNCPHVLCKRKSPSCQAAPVTRARKSYCRLVRKRTLVTSAGRSSRISNPRTFPFISLCSPVESMKAERAKAAFNIRDMTYLLDGGKSATEVRYQVLRVSSCPN